MKAKLLSYAILPLLSVPSLHAGASALSPDGNSHEEAMKFLYDNMALADSVNYPRDFYDSCVTATLDARERMPWGRNIPDDIWKHFVLPLRVNNEDLDSARTYIYHQLAPVVAGMTMEEAALEVNYWCQRHVAYAPSDARTRSPLATLSAATGRCGEESVLGVNAMRAVGIPARQVYTPRWAHTDDNHAWIEVWIDGKWRFLGACEPEPVLDLGWFNQPASRGMLMNSQVFGSYGGAESLGYHNGRTTINVTDNYVPTDTLRVHVTDRNGRPVPDAETELCIYNYAEFYPIASKRTDADGNTYYVCGIGDGMVRASADGDGNMAYFTMRGDRNVSLVLDGSAYDAVSERVMTPPSGRNNFPVVTAEMRSENLRRKAYGDSVRAARIAGWPDMQQTAEYAARFGVNFDSLYAILRHSRGNYMTVIDFIKVTPAGMRPRAMRLLSAVNTKDLSDITADVLADHLDSDSCMSAYYDEYVLNPRVSTERLTPYKRYFRERFSKDERRRFRDDPSRWAAWFDKNIIADNGQDRITTMSPGGVMRTGRADVHSRNVAMVAGARAFGIPARINEVTGDVQYYRGDAWHNFASDSSAGSADNITVSADSATWSAGDTGRNGYLALSYTPNGTLKTPQYYNHFTISAIADGKLSLLTYPEGMTVQQMSAAPLSMKAGRYVLTSGQRLADGSVLTRIEPFDISAGDTTAVRLTMRRDTTAVQVIGNFNSENLYHPLGGGDAASLLSATGRGYYTIAVIKPGHEPSAHILNDLSAIAGELEADGRKIVILLDSKESAGMFDASRFDKLPSTTVLGYDDGTILDELTGNLELEGTDLPVVVIADTFNRVVFVTTGYNIGIGNTLLDILHRVQ